MIVLLSLLQHLLTINNTFSEKENGMTPKYNILLHDDHTAANQEQKEKAPADQAGAKGGFI